jgi:branched-chain amino acid transport system permease protein
MLVLGGLGRLYGGILGALAFVVAHHLLSAMTPQFWQFWIGAAMVALALAGRGGALGLLDAAAARLRERGGGIVATGPGTRDR